MNMVLREFQLKLQVCAGGQRLSRVGYQLSQLALGGGDKIQFSWIFYGTYRGDLACNKIVRLSEN